MPSSASSERSPAPSAEKFDSHPASTKSGSVASTTSEDGARSASTGTSAASSARCSGSGPSENAVPTRRSARPRESTSSVEVRSEEHTSELQSRGQLVCRLLLEEQKHKDKRLCHPGSFEAICR